MKNRPSCYAIMHSFVTIILVYMSECMLQVYFSCMIIFILQHDLSMYTHLYIIMNLEMSVFPFINMQFEVAST